MYNYKHYIKTKCPNIPYKLKHGNENLFKNVVSTENIQAERFSKTFNF